MLWQVRHEVFKEVILFYGRLIKEDFIYEEVNFGLAIIFTDF